MGRNRLPDEIAACNLIRQQRKSERESRKSKCITIRINKENDIFITTKLFSTYNINTNVISYTHALHIKNAFIYPTTHQKLRCIDHHAIELLNKKRKRNLINYYKRKEEALKFVKGVI